MRISPYLLYFTASLSKTSVYSVKWLKSTDLLKLSTFFYIYKVYLFSSSKAIHHICF